jgi:predicted Zn-dependent protease
MASMFNKLLNERQSQPGALDTWFASHPLEEERIQNARNAVAAINPAIIRSLTKNTTGFNDFKARVKTLPPPPVITKR